MTKEAVEIPLQAAIGGSLPPMSFRSGVPTTHRTARKVKLPLNAADGAFAAVGLAALGAFGIGGYRYRVVTLRLPLTLQEQRADKLRLAAGFALMLASFFLPLLPMATLGEGGQEAAAIAVAVVLFVGAWVLAWRVLAPVREAKPSRKGTLRMRVHPSFASALGAPQPHVGTGAGRIGMTAAPRPGAPLRPAVMPAPGSAATWPPRGNPPRPAPPSSSLPPPPPPPPGR